MVEHKIFEAIDDLEQTNFILEQWRVLFGWWM